MTLNPLFYYSFVAKLNIDVLLLSFPLKGVQGVLSSMALESGTRMAGWLSSQGVLQSDETKI